ncbi:MAG: glycine zipper 2TM domain-containing protein [Ideonella sp.]|nr:glycine zipper 2TM domain-containing protein [Ideonella sp.]
MKKLALSLMVLASLGACSTTSPDVIKREDAQRMSTIQDGVLLSIRTVKVDGTQSGIGGIAGGVIGGVAGSSVGGKRESVVVGVLGAVAGAVVGNAIERASTQEEAVELLVQLKNGDRRAIVQAKGTESLQAGEQVIIVTTGNKIRVTRAPAGTPPLAGASAPVYSPR